MDLSRYMNAQAKHYAIALAELKDGYKTSHWMWFVFPQIAGLGHSHKSIFYAIANLDEAKAYLKHKVLGGRLIEISNVLLQQHTDDASMIFGIPDNMKLHSSMTLFAIADKEHQDNVFEKVLAKFFKGKYDTRTLELLHYS